MLKIKQPKVRKGNLLSASSSVLTPKNNIKLIDEIDSVLHGFDRIQLQTSLKTFMKKQSWRVRWKFDIPRYVVLNNLQSVPIAVRFEEFKKKAYKAGL